MTDQLRVKKKGERGRAGEKGKGRQGEMKEGAAAKAGEKKL